MQALRTPVLFIIFNQPEITREVFNAIRAARPQKLFVAADGPRADHAQDKEECELARAVIDLVDWECEVQTKFRDANVGCRINVSEAVSWFLNDVGEGIILEFDCLPHPSFFEYCTTMLDRYRHDTRVLSICGSNLQFGECRGDGDYFFAHLPNTWGWATWKRAWDTWHGDLPGLPQFLALGHLNDYLHTTAAKRHLKEKFLEVYEGRNKTTWGFGWVYAHLVRSAMSVYPNTNLVSNLGFNPNATHAVDAKSAFSRIPLVGLTSLRAPSFQIACIDADETVIRVALQQRWTKRLRAGVGFAVCAVLGERGYRFLKKFLLRSSETS